jgi:spermidine/putrescine ABC transporter ATP-binding subunit
MTVAVGEIAQTTDAALIAEAPPADALRLDRVSRRFSGFVAVDDVSLNVRQGEFLTLLGPSGCGKTTILRMVAGFETPTSGTIHIADRDMAGVPAYRRPIGIVFQNLALFPHMTVGGNIAFGLEVQRLPKAEIKTRVADALSLIGLDGMADRRVHQMSGGQRQRVALARALVLRPSVLLLDEPLGALDLKLRRQLQIELKRLQKQVGTTFVFVTHDQEEALTMSNRIAVMNHGRIEQLAGADEIYHRPATAFVAQFVGETNFLFGKVASLGANSEMVVDLPEIAVSVVVDRGGRPFAAGDAVSLSIRPENIRILAHADDALEPSAPGEITEIMYAGLHIRYTLRIGGRAIVASAPTAPSTPAQWSIGDHVRVGWNSRDAISLPVSSKEHK